MKKKLMTPGPVPLSPELLKVLAEPIIHHRTPAFQEILESTFKKLKLLFGTSQPVMSLVSTGSGAMEASMVNVLSPGDHILCINGGKFGERWLKMGQRFGYHVHELKTKWGEPVRLADVQQALNDKPEIKAIFVQACETSTGTLHPVQELAEITKNKPDLLLVVDGITAVGAMDIPMDEWGIDILLAGSQKALMLPTGLSFIALSEKAWSFYKKATSPRYYFDLGQERKSNEKGQTFFSSAVTLVRALDLSLDLQTGAKKTSQLKRTSDLAQATREAAVLLGLKVFSKSPSESLTAIELPEDLDGVAFRQHIEDQHGIVVMGGQDHYKGRLIRIGHMGFISDEDLYETIAAIGHSLIHFKVENFDLDYIDEALSEAHKLLNN